MVVSPSGCHIACASLSAESVCPNQNVGSKYLSKSGKPSRRSSRASSGGSSRSGASEVGILMMRQQQGELKQVREAMAAELGGICEDSHRANASLMGRIQHSEAALAAEQNARVRDAAAADAKLTTVLEEKAVHEAGVTTGVQTEAVSPVEPEPAAPELSPTITAEMRLLPPLSWLPRRTLRPGRCHEPRRRSPLASV
ncbi:hypothetical protein PI124_g16554 [Phytophthora idaei]|nr:hypothetical protein PI125_g3807 [Phytophthora idaei]KAG3143092.1 hypothetical protein PI126_g14776 [Phytophthora idaei]KAG3238490.1 hypothetical protein PI124_g16554 [Phytophthora idaei]